MEELRGKATWEEVPKVEGGKTSVFEGDFESSAHCSAISMATANAEKPGRKGEYALFFGGRAKGVVLSIHVTVATGLPKDTQIRRASSTGGEPASSHLTLPCLTSWRRRRLPPTHPHSGF